VPHFVGLHGIQVLLLVVFAVRRVDERVRARLVGVAALGYTGVLAVVTWQAARGQALLEPDAVTLAALPWSSWPPRRGSCVEGPRRS
jgi:hypothetical protein